MYNITLNEFGKLLKEYNEIEEIKQHALYEHRTGHHSAASITMKQHTDRREEFVKKFRKA